MQINDIIVAANILSTESSSIYSLGFTYNPEQSGTLKIQSDNLEFNKKIYNYEKSSTDFATIVDTEITNALSYIKTDDDNPITKDSLFEELFKR